MDVEEIWRKKCVSYIRWFEGVRSITEGSRRGQACNEPLEVSDLQGNTFSGLHQWDMWQ
jgi:hypothetical protein